MTRSFKSSLVLLVMMLWCGLANGQSFMTFYDTAGGPMASWSLHEVSKVTFDEGNIVVKNLAGDDIFAINEVLSIKFTDQGIDDPTSVEKISSDVSSIRIATDENSVRVIGANAGRVVIWAVNGQQLYNNRNWHGESIDITQLERGIYIITINNNTFKFKK